jgi:SM-20-related protein
MPLLDAWARRSAQHEPYRWLSTAPGDLMPAERAQLLADQFPLDGFQRRDESRRASGKQYRNASRTITPADLSDDDAMPAAWRELVLDLLASDYLRDIARILDQPPAAAVEIRLVQHGSGDWLGPHTDREDKLFSHILYFNDGWREEWGGCLEILHKDDPAAVAGRVVPMLGASALLAQAPNSWHQVTPVRGAGKQRRRSLLVHGLRAPDQENALQPA